MPSSVTEEDVLKLREAKYLAYEISHRLPAEGQAIPTPEPGEPSPTPITPITGAISLTAIGVVSILSGAGLMFARRKED